MHSRRRVIPDALLLKDDDGGGDLSLGAKALQLSPILPISAGSNNNNSINAISHHVPAGSSSSSSLRPPYMLKRSSSQGHVHAHAGAISGINGGNNTPTTSTTPAPAPAPPAIRYSHRRKQTLTRENELPTAVLPTEVLDKIHAVIDSICIVRFDLDSGPGKMHS